MAQMYLLVAVTEPGCSGFGAKSKNVILGFCEKRFIDSYMANLQVSGDRRLWLVGHVLSIPVPDSGMVDLGSDLDTFDSLSGLEISYIPLR